MSAWQLKQLGALPCVLEGRYQLRQLAAQMLKPHQSRWEQYLVKFTGSNVLKSPLESISVLGCAKVQWYVVPRLGSFCTESTLSKLQTLLCTG